MYYYLLDLGILGIIALTTFLGYKKGLIKLAFGLFSFIIALVISLLLYKPVSNVIMNYTPIPNKVESQIEQRITSSDTEEKESFISNYYHNFKSSSTKAIAKSITSSVISILSVLIVFIISRLLLLFLKFTGDFLAKLPLIKQCNSLGGFVYGLLIGFILIYVVFTIISILAPFIDITKIILFINHSIIGNIMYNNNIIFMLFAQ